MVARLNKKQRRQLRQKGRLEEVEAKKFHLDIKEITPATYNQEIVFDAFENNKFILMHGCAGTGKTFIALYLGLDEVLNGNSGFKKVIIYRSMVPTRDAGFMPGNLKEKAAVYERPYIDICTKLFGRTDAYETLKTKGIIEFTTTSYVRGNTEEQAIVIVDEFQNMTLSELNSLMTRAGKNVQYIICGDNKYQSDFNGKEIINRNGVNAFIKIIENMHEDFEVINFTVDDIVRSGFVKRFIITMDSLGYTT